MPDQNTIASKLTVTKIPHLNTLVVKQTGKRFFIATPDSFVIDIPGLSFLLKFLVMNDLLSYRVLEGILDEYTRSKNEV